MFNLQSDEYAANVLIHKTSNRSSSRNYIILIRVQYRALNWVRLSMRSTRLQRDVALRGSKHFKSPLTVKKSVFRYKFW